MRRIVLCLGLVAAAGCGSVKGMFSAHAREAASASGQVLTPDSLAAILGRLKGARLAPETAEFVANIWVDNQLFGQALADNKLATDSAAVAEVMWPEITERIGSAWHDTLLARRTALTPASADSAYAATGPEALRVVQHILVRAAAGEPDSVKAKARKKIEQIQSRLRSGANFGQLAAAMSDDPGSKADSGYLPPSPRGAFVTSFDSAAWTLAPGQMSGIVESPYGYHILRRPTLPEARARLLQNLVQRAGFRLDSVYMDSLASSRHLKVAGSAAALLRRAMQDRDGYRNSSKELASFDRGGLTVREMLKWAAALPSQMMAQLSAARDTQVVEFIRAVAQNALLVDDARQHGIHLSATDWAALQQNYRAGVDSIRAAMGLGTDITDPKVPQAEREKAAALQVATYLDKGFRREGRLVPIPGPMSSYLRDRLASRIDNQGVDRAVELALAAQAKSEAKADSAAKANGQLPPSQLPPGMQGQLPPQAPAKK